MASYNFSTWVGRVDDKEILHRDGALHGHVEKKVELSRDSSDSLIEGENHVSVRQIMDGC